MQASYQISITILVERQLIFLQSKSFVGYSSSYNQDEQQSSTTKVRENNTVPSSCTCRESNPLTCFAAVGLHV